MQEPHLLKTWRLHAGLLTRDVDGTLDWPNGLTEEYEHTNIMKIPLRHLYALIDLYGIPENSLIAMIKQELTIHPRHQETQKHWRFLWI